MICLAHKMTDRSVESAMDRREHPTSRLSEQTTLADVLTRYRDTVVPTFKGARPTTYRINTILRHPMSRCSMTDLTPTVVAAWRDDRLRKVSPGSLLREIAILRSAVRRARNDWGIEIQECPIGKITKPKDNPSRERRVTPEEESRLYAGCEKSRNAYLRPAIEFAIHTAMRQGEIISLRWENVDLNRQTACLPTTKNGKSRTVPLSTRAVEVLQALPPDTERVFDGLSIYSVRHAFRRLTERQGVHDLHFHDLRHEAISRFVERGLNLIEVASISGHQTLQMLKRYTHLRAEDLAKKLG
ncbi:site-specific integrase [Burkholderia ubonensis]|uniref:site-specific integrase n=1 Tax=Burkholderia ubonensis TaxID=101571 RepID=UPI0009B37BC5